MRGTKVTQKDINDIIEFSHSYEGQTTLACIEAYAKKRKIQISRSGKAFWAAADEGDIKINLVEGIFYIAIAE